MCLATGNTAKIRALNCGIVEAGRDATFVFLDTLTGGLYLEDKVDIDVYQDTWPNLTANALDFHTSMSVIRQKASEHRS